MRESLKLACDEFISARDALKGIFRMEHDQMYPVCAAIFLSAGMIPEEESLRAARKLVRSSVGIFSSFRGTAEFPLVSMLACAEDPAGKWERTQDAYSCLRERFFSSEFLAIAALMLSDAGDIAGIADRGKRLYKRMKAEHPFLTGQEDSVFALLLAESSRPDDALIEDMEATYRLLGAEFPKGDGLQSASHVLAFDETPPAQKAARLLEIYDGIVRLGGKYGRDGSLATLAALSITGEDPKDLAADVMDADAFLKEQKGYRSIFGLDRRTRAMHAVMIVSNDLTPENVLMTAAAGNAALAVIAAQQAAMCAAISSSAAAAAAASSSN